MDRVFHSDQVEAHLIEKHGYFVHLAKAPCGTINAHTHGFPKSWGHPNIQVVLPMCVQKYYGFLNKLAGMVRAGYRFEVGRRYNGLLGGDYIPKFVDRFHGNELVLRCLLVGVDFKVTWFDTMDEAYTGLTPAELADIPVGLPDGVLDEESP